MLAWLKRNKGLLLALVLTAVFVVLELEVMYWKGDAMVAMVPLAMLALWLFVTRFETGLLCMALLTPFAVNMSLMPGMELSMPVEPLMIVFSGMFLFRVLASKSYDTRILRHPVALLLLASLAWMAFTSATSELPWVSLKYTLARVWFVLPFFFAAAQIFKDQRRI